MSDRSALFDVRSSTSVTLDQVVRRDTVEIPAEVPLAIGDAIVIETPGGGGFGAPSDVETAA